MVPFDLNTLQPLFPNATCMMSSPARIDRVIVWQALGQNRIR